MADITRLRKFAEKKRYQVAAATVKHTDVGSTALQELFNLPGNALITDACVVVKTAGQSSLTVDFGFDGGNELGNDLDIDGTGVVSVPLNILALTLTEGTPNTLSAGTVTKAPRLDTGTGKTVTAKFSADPTAGEFVFIVEFIEYDLGNGEYMNYGDG